MIEHSALRALVQEDMVGDHVQLEPVSLQHREGLRIAANHVQIWHYMPDKPINEYFDPWFDECLARMSTGEQITYVVRHIQDRTILGATAFYDIQLDNRRLALGYSWFSPDQWGAMANPESKLLMLSQAIERWGINRVEIGTDSRNRHSYNAIKKLGAKEEGILRQHMILHDGEITDTIVFSILASEWPEIKMRLTQRLQRGK